MNPTDGGEPMPSTGGGEPSAEPQGEPTNLPSDEPQAVSFEIKPDDLQDGKFQGKWGSPVEMAEHIKNIEDKYANLKRDVTNGEKQTDAEIAEIAKQTKVQQTQQSTIQDLAPQFIENGMQLSDEMMETLKETGLTETEIKLGAYELKESLDKNANYVGGKENYDIIMDYHAKTMNDEQKRQFNHSIQDPNNSEALMLGLQAMYEKNSTEDGQEVSQGRVRGNSPANTNAIKPYESKRELLRDKSYADSRNASQADKAKFRARLNATPDEVWRS